MEGKSEENEIERTKKKENLAKFKGPLK